LLLVGLVGASGICEVVTVLYSDDFEVGVRTLGSSLDRTGIFLPRTVLVTSHVSQATIKALEKNGWSTEVVEAHVNPHNHERGARSRLNMVFTKLEVWGRTHTKHGEPVRRMIYLDGDTIVTERIDELCHCEARLCAVTRDVYFNAGVMVLTPSPSLKEYMLDTYQQTPSYNQGEQGFLNRVFPEFQRCPYHDPRDRHPIKEEEELPQCLRLPPFYNGDLGLYVVRGNRWEVDPRMERDRPKVIHYTMGPAKPWHFYAYTVGQPAMWEWYSHYAEAYSSELTGKGVGVLFILVPFVFGACMAINCSTKIQEITLPHVERYRLPITLFTLILALYGGWVVAISVPFAHPYVSMLALYTVFYCMTTIFFVAPFVPKERQANVLIALFALLIVVALLLVSESMPIALKPLLITVELCALWFLLVPYGLEQPPVRLPLARK